MSNGDRIVLVLEIIGGCSGSGIYSDLETGSRGGCGKTIVGVVRIEGTSSIQAHLEAGMAIIVVVI